VELFGYSLTRTKAAGMDLVTHVPQITSPWSGFMGYIRESFAGAWQRGITISTPDVLTQSTVWACVSLIMSDIGKLPPRLLKRVGDTDIWEPADSGAYSPVVRKPNHFQNRIKFYEHWIASKLTRGNTYVLKERDGRGVVTRLYILDPTRVQVLVAPDSSVYYQLQVDNLAGLQHDEAFPASEIIHDVGIAMYHPLAGMSPIAACGLAAMQALKIQNNSTKFFSNNSNPGGVLTAPKEISTSTADRIQAHWEANYAGEDNIGKVAVLGDGLEYKPMMVTAVDAQLVDQLKWTAETICSCFHVPPYMVGIGPMPTYNNIEALNQQYYSQCLQSLIESIELCLDEGLDLPPDYWVEFDVDSLIRMDSATKMKNATDGVKGGVYSPDEARRKFNLRGVPGGEAPYLQQQNYSLAALAKRDAGPDPFGTTAPAPAAPSDEAKRFRSRLLTKVASAHVA
jgi:HK97 family phage portal protein